MLFLAAGNITVELLRLGQHEGSAASAIHQQDFQLQSREARELWRETCG